MCHASILQKLIKQAWEIFWKRAAVMQLSFACVHDPVCFIGTHSCTFWSLLNIKEPNVPAETLRGRKSSLPACHWMRRDPKHTHKAFLWDPGETAKTRIQHSTAPSASKQIQSRNTVATMELTPPLSALTYSCLPYYFLSRTYISPNPVLINSFVCMWLCIFSTGCHSWNARLILSPVL